VQQHTRAVPAGGTPSTGRVRAMSAAVFLALAVAAVPVIMLAWGRMGASASAPAAPGRPPLPPEGARWAVDLSREDGDRLLEAFFAALEAEAGAAATPPPGRGGDGPPIPVFVTAYVPGADPVRVCGYGAEPEEGVREAAAMVRARANPALEPGRMRVRIDVVREALPFSERHRMAFVRRPVGEPVGVALRSGERYHWFLPGDIADDEAADGEAVLMLLCRRAGLRAGRWRQAGLPMWRLRVAGFVNSAPGSRYAMASPRGLAPLSEPTVARLRRACRMAADYLLRSQQPDGRFVTYRDAATGLRGGCETVTEQAVAAGALGMLAELRPEVEYVEAAYRCLSYAMAATDLDAAGPMTAVTRRQEVCNVAYELETTAQVLEALCRYRRVSGQSAPDAWILAMARFLLSMQGEDGRFHLAYDAVRQERLSPGLHADSPIPQAKAAAALLLAHRELGIPACLSGAGRALVALRDSLAARPAPLQAREARWLAAALREAAPLFPDEGFDQWLCRISAERRTAQVLPADAPAADLVGATLERLPPTAQTTADDLVVFVSASMMDGPDRAADLAAARRAAAWLMHLLYLPENSYYLADPGAAEGGLREQIGSNVIRVQSLESALRGMAMLTRLELQDMRTNDREG